MARKLNPPKEPKPLPLLPMTNQKVIGLSSRTVNQTHPYYLYIYFVSLTEKTILKYNIISWK